MRKVPFKKGELYHVFNRGVDKQNIFKDQGDFQRFFRSILEFNSVEPIGSIFENSTKKRQKERFGHPMSKLVNIICYCINPNHYHFILEQLVDGGIEKFIQKLGNGYTKYFDHKYKRSGVLFQGKFKSVHVDYNEYLLHLSVYVNLNNLVHKINFGHRMSKSSWEEYIRSGEVGLCKNKKIILGQFRNKKEYKQFAEKFVKGMIGRKEMLKDMENYTIE
jgi:REP element-mobilizing transposase RayT